MTQDIRAAAEPETGPCHFSSRNTQELEVSGATVSTLALQNWTGQGAAGPALPLSSCLWKAVMLFKAPKAPKCSKQTDLSWLQMDLVGSLISH